MVDLANSGKLNPTTGMVLTIPAATRIDQAPPLSLSTGRQSSSAVGITLPEFNIQKPDQPDRQSAEQIENTVAHLKDYVQSIHRDIHFSIHEVTGRTVITVTDGKTGEEIRKIPSDEILAVATRLAEFLEELQEGPESGLLFDTHI